MEARGEAVEELQVSEAPFDFEQTFHAQYGRIAGVIARVVRDYARAEDIGPMVHWRPHDLLGRHIPRGAQYGSG